MPLRKRFPEEDTGLLSKFDVLNPAAWPKDIAQLKTFESDEISHLAKHYREYFAESQDLPSQWHMFTSVVHESYRQALTSFSTLADLVFSRFCTPFLSVSIDQLAAVLRISSAYCERGFSVQNIIKTHKRSCLKPTTLQHLQLIKLEGPPLREFDFHSTVLKFKTKKNRRIKTGQ